MARTRRKRRFRPEQVDPEAVLRDRIQLSADDLMALIRWVNPTLDDLDDGESRRRYALKNRLQSHLLRAHPDAVEVAFDETVPGVVILRGRGGGPSACHALLDELEEDVRSRVRRRLDAQAAPVATDGDRAAASGGRTRRNPISRADPPRRVPRRHDSPEALLAEGHSALEEYDLEGAREAFEAAVAADRRSATAARALLSLLVEHLAAYADALHHFACSLEGAAVADSDVRALAALAAAHAGERKEAGRIARGLEGERIAEVWLVLADASLKAGGERDVEAAAGDVLRARQAIAAGAVPTELLRLEDALEEARARLRAPEESAIEAAHQDGRVADATRRAEALLQRQPDSRVARRVLHAIEEARRAEEVASRLEAARRAVHAQDFEAAVLNFDRAIAAGAGAAAAATEIAAEREAARKALMSRQAEAKVEEASRLLSEGKHEAALRCYLDLEPQLRERVRNRTASPLFAWLDATGAPSRARVSEAIPAVLALAAARASLEAAQPEAALGALKPHRRALDSVPEARRTRETAENALGEARARIAAARLEEARARFAEGALADAGRLLDKVDRAALGDAQRSEAEALPELLAAAEQVSRLERQIEEHAAAGHLLAARDAAAALASAASDPAQAAGARAQAEDLQARIQAAWRVRVVPGDDTPVPIPLVDRFSSDVERLLTEDGNAVVLAKAIERRVFVCIVSLDRLRPITWASLETPEPVGFIDVVVEGNILWIVGTNAALKLDAQGLLDARGLDVLGWWPISGYLEGDEQPDDQLLAPGGRHLWIQPQVPGHYRTHLRIVDLTTGFVARRFKDVIVHMTLVLDPKTPRVLGLRGLGGDVHEPHGAAAAGWRVPDTVRINCATPVPGGPGMVLSCASAESKYTTIDLCRLEPEDRLGADLLYDDDTCYAFEFRHALATSQAEGMVYLLAPNDDRDYDLVAFSENAGGDIAIRWRIRVPDDAGFIADGRGHRLALQYGTRSPDGGWAVARLGASPPRIPASAFRHSTEASRLGDPLPDFKARLHSCRPQADPDIVWALADQLRAQPESGLQAWVDSYCSNADGDPVTLCRLVDALSMTSHHQIALSVAMAVWERFPADPRCGLGYVEILSLKGRWEEVIRVIDGLALEEAPWDVCVHLHHLQGLAHLASGDNEAAWNVWVAGSRIERANNPNPDNAPFECRLAALAGFVEPLPRPLRDDAAWLAAQPRARRLRAEVALADQYFERGEPAAAIAVLERGVVWSCREIQSLARLARAWLALDPDSGPGPIRKALALATFLRAREGHEEVLRHEPLELPFPEGTLSKAALDALTQEARSWLERHG